MTLDWERRGTLSGTSERVKIAQGLRIDHPLMDAILRETPLLPKYPVSSSPRRGP